MISELKERLVNIEGYTVRLTNLDKVMYPDHITKGDVIRYYYDVSATLLPHIINRPLVLKRYPNGIAGDFFYQKECPSHAPDWLQTATIAHGDKHIKYVVCNNLASLVWLINLGCLEIHAWTAKIDNIDCPDIGVIDLDPAEGIDFSEVIKVALLVREALKEFGINCYPKTSGSRGMHLYIPLEPKYTFQEVTKAMKYIAGIVVDVYPARCTIERAVKKRGQKIYLDYLQNTRGKTMAWQYSLRPNPKAAVSTPLLWEEVEKGGFDAQQFTLSSVVKRINKFGDIFYPLLINRYQLDRLLAQVG
ncbi:non-homologous end-joining DNA ligase [Desulfofalx alkaliphila]|uniref:non-homologous end-joining DNA ligase n=1 Tax=Desulfofalx alkaliphila TaxID=105483 RepID=UPI0004E243B6|nr:non-homologous end-joining DNA ligase [Desulfofalx alkaliphila]